MAKEDPKALLKRKAGLRDSAQRHIVKNQIEKAIQDYRALFELDPSDLRIRLKIGDLLLRMGRKEEALREYSQTAERYASEGQLVQAIAVHKLILKHEPKRKEVADRLAQLLCQKGISGIPTPEGPMGIPEEVPEEEGAGMGIVFEPFEEAEEEIHPPPPSPPRRPLPDIPLFSGLPKEAFLDLLERVKVRQYPEKALLFKEGDAGDSIYVVTQGRVRISRFDRQGNRIWLKDLGEGEFFGEFGYFANARRHASVEALSEVECLEVARSDMEALSRQWPEISETLFRFYRNRVLSTLLAFSPLFGRIDPHQRDAFLERFTRKVFRQGEMVIRQGEKGEAFYLVKSGRLEVFREDGGEQRRLAELRPGDFFGEIALLTEGPRMASVRTIERSELVCLDVDSFRAVLDAHPEIRTQIEKQAADRLEEAIHIVKASEKETGLV